MQYEPSNSLSRIIVRSLIEKPHFLAAMAFILIVYGISILPTIKITQEPEVKLQTITLSFILPGSTPTQLEREVVFPLEGEFRNLEGLTELRTITRHNNGIMILKYLSDVDLSDARAEVDAIVERRAHDLPKNVEIFTKKATASDNLTAFLIGIKPRDEASNLEDAHRLAVQLKNALSQVSGLKNVRLVEAEQEIEIAIDPLKQKNLLIPTQNIINAIQSYNRGAPTGLQSSSLATIRIKGAEFRIDSPEDLLSIPVIANNGSSYRLSDVAKVKRRYANNAVISTRYNGEPVFFVEAGIDPNQANVIQIAAQVRGVTEQIDEFSKGLETFFVYDQSEDVRKSLSSLGINMIQGLVILCLILVLLLEIRAALIITSLLPIASFVAITLLILLDYGIQRVTIAGFIIALGLMVDNAIVVTENARTLELEHGLSRKEAAIEGAAQAAAPLTSSMLTTMVAFSPVFLFETGATLFLRSLTVTVWLSLLASLAVAITFTALLISRFGTFQPIPKLPKIRGGISRITPFVEETYPQILRYCHRKRGWVLGLFAVVLITSIASLRLVKVDVFPPSDVPYLTINIDFPLDYNEHERLLLLKEVEDALDLDRSVKEFNVVSGIQHPWLHIAMDVRADATFFVQLDTAKTSEVYVIQERLTRAVAHLQDVAALEIALFKFKDQQYSAPFSVVIEGRSGEDLERVASQVASVIASVEGVRNFENPAASQRNAIRIAIDERAARLYEVPKFHLDQIQLMMTYGAEIDRLRAPNGEEFPILATYDAELGLTHLLAHIDARSVSGNPVPINSVSRLELEPDLVDILHKDFVPTVEIGVWPENSVPVSIAVERIEEALETVSLDPDVQLRIGGLLEKDAENYEGFGTYALLIAVVIFTIFMLQFQSFKQPIVVFAAIPFCMVGVIFSLIITDTTLTFLGILGITSLMGIVVNDSILLVDEANSRLLRTPSQDRLETVIDAAKHRFSPILVTSITTTFGLIPLAFSASQFQVMAITIIGGLTFATLILLVLVPVLYIMLVPKAESIT